MTDTILVRLIRDNLTMSSAEENKIVVRNWVTVAGNKSDIRHLPSSYCWSLFHYWFSVMVGPFAAV